MAQQGGCMCGSVRYSVEGEPAVKGLCHCLDCRKISGSTYSINAIYPEAAFKLLQGSPKQHSTTAEGGNTITSMFCGDCGSTLWREGPSFAGLRIVKAGTLDDINALANLKPDTELFVASRVNWIPEVEGAKQAQRMS